MNIIYCFKRDLAKALTIFILGIASNYPTTALADSSNQLCSLQLPTPEASNSTHDSWELSETKKDLEIFVKTVSGSDYKAVRAVMKIDATAPSVFSAFGSDFTKPNGCSEWRSQCKKSKVIETISEQSNVIYLVLDLPWPIADRDLVLKYRVDEFQNTGMRRLYGETVDNSYPQQGLIRAQSTLLYCIKPNGDNGTDVIYEMHTLLNGDVPTSLFNSQLVESTVKEMLALKASALKAEMKKAN